MPTDIVKSNAARSIKGEHKAEGNDPTQREGCPYKIEDQKTGQAGSCNENL